VVGLAALDLRLALAGLAALPIQAGAARWYLRRSRPLYAAERQAEGRRSQHLHTGVTGAATIRALRLQDDHVATITRTSQEAVDLAVSAASVRARFFSALNSAELVGLATVLAVGYPLVQGGSLTVGGATAGALYFYRLFDPIGELLFQLDAAQEAGAALARLVGVTSLPAPPAGAAPAPVAAAPPTGAAGAAGAVAAPAPAPAPAPAARRGSGLELRGVSFSYDGKHRALDGVDLVVRPGERVALVGPSGAGKSTVAKLVAGIHPATAGTVDCPDAVALVTQEVHVFSGPLAADLRLASPDAPDDRLRAVLDRVGATSWVEALPDGLDTVVGDGGHRLSPTQAQQLALARLLLADPDVAILDEATAEAGSAGAGVLDAAAAAAVEGRTALVIAHRLTQAAAADRVVVLDNGRVVEQGPHAELLTAGGTYAGLWAAWSTPRTNGSEPTA
jgi:ATP-binding cassette subfamily C protein